MPPLPAQQSSTQPMQSLPGAVMQTTRWRCQRSCGGQPSCSQQAPRRPRLACRVQEGSSASAADALARRVKLSFKIPYRCSFGQEVCMVGNAREMGRWDVTSGVAMRWTEGDVWTVEFEVDAGPNLEVEYKYVIRDSKKGEVVCWKPGDNYQIRVPVYLEKEQAIAEGVRVRDAWDGSIQDISVEVSDYPPGSAEWTAEQEFKTMEAAVNRALNELDALVDRTTDMSMGLDPTSPELLNADRVVAAAARKAMQMQGALSAASVLYQQQQLPGKQPPPQTEQDR